MSVKIEGLDTVLANIHNILPIETAKLNARLSIAGVVAQNAITEQAGLTDHTLKQLAKDGHPYSTRYPTDGSPHGDDSRVHIQSGLLKANIVKNENLNTELSIIEVGVSEDAVPYIGDLITGTSIMRPRNFIGEGFRKVKEDIKISLGGK